MSVHVKRSLEETTLNAIWNADRKRGVTFFENGSNQFRIMREALEQARAEEREACAKLADARSCVADETECDCENDGARREARYLAELIRAR